jgi:hypothetical protein
MKLFQSLLLCAPSSAEFTASDFDFSLDPYSPTYVRDVLSFLDLFGPAVRQDEELAKGNGIRIAKLARSAARQQQNFSEDGASNLLFRSFDPFQVLPDFQKQKTTRGNELEADPTRGLRQLKLMVVAMME